MRCPECGHVFEAKDALRSPKASNGRTVYRDSRGCPGCGVYRRLKGFPPAPVER